ncbi:MAG: hypothetical protein AB7I48_10795 [Planctomycetaceae bacterium]
MSEPMSVIPSASPDVCPQCGNDADWKSSSWCAACGYYPAIGRLVETPAAENEETVYENWWEAVPEWMWILAGGVIALFVTSVGVRVVFAESAVRVWWTVAQLVIGVVAFFAAHLLAYLHGASRSDRIGPLDAFMKPIATWQPVLRSLPEKVKLLWTGSWSLTAVLMAMFVIDGIDYQALAEARKEKDDSKKKTNPMAFVIKSAQTVATAQNGLPNSGGDAESLEDALSEFTGADGTEDGYAEMPQESGSAESLAGAQSGEGADADGVGTTAEPGSEADGTDSASGAASNEVGASDQKKLPGGPTSIPDRENLKESIQCMVIGYTTNRTGEPRSLLLAAPIRDRLRFVAKVPLERIEQRALAGIPEQLPSLHQGRPVTASPFGGRWLKPELFCDVRYSGWTTNGRLSDAYVTQFALVAPAMAQKFDSAMGAP